MLIQISLPYGSMAGTKPAASARARHVRPASSARWAGRWTTGATLIARSTAGHASIRRLTLTPRPVSPDAPDAPLPWCGLSTFFDTVDMPRQRRASSSPAAHTVTARPDRGGPHRATTPHRARPGHHRARPHHPGRVGRQPVLALDDDARRRVDVERRHGRRGPG